MGHTHLPHRFEEPGYKETLLLRGIIELLILLLAAGLIVLSLEIKATSAPYPQDDKTKKEQKKLREYSKDIKEVLELKDYGLKKLQGKEDADMDFKSDVVRAYNDMRRTHQLQAFRVNTRAPLRVMGDLEGEGGNFAARSSGAEASSGGMDALYDNPMLQDYVSRIGHRLVPQNSRKLYAFKILQDPLPRADSLSTGTIYLSTGLLGMLDNEAQLAYILSHEIAHVEMDHWFYQSMLPIALAEKNEDKEKKRQRIGALMALGGIALGAKSDGLQGAYQGASLGYGLGHLIGDLAIRDVKITEWNIADEDDADRFAFQNCLANGFDVQEVPKLFLNLYNAVLADQRVGLGFMSSLQHVYERNEGVKLLLKENENTIRQLSSQGKLIGSHSEFEVLMAELKRDNGVVAFYYDMFDMTRKNLEWSLRIRSDDAKAHYYLGRVLKLTSRTPEERERARREFATALKLDETRGSMPGIRLQQALSLLDTSDPTKFPEAVTYIKEYVRLYKLNNGGSVPPNMDILYDYMSQAGETAWFVPPTSNVTAQEVFPVVMKSSPVTTPPSNQPPPNTQVQKNPGKKN